MDCNPWISLALPEYFGIYLNIGVLSPVSNKITGKTKDGSEIDLLEPLAGIGAALSDSQLMYVESKASN